MKNLSPPDKRVKLVGATVIDGTATAVYEREGAICVIQHVRGTDGWVVDESPVLHKKAEAIRLAVEKLI